MAESRKRHKHPHHHQHAAQDVSHASHQPAKRAGLILAVFIGLLGLAVAFFAVGTSTAALIGAAVGAAIGFLIGSSLDRAAAKKKL